MNFDKFIEHLPARVRAGLSKKSSKMWFGIHSHVYSLGQTDRYDSALRKELHEATGQLVSETDLKSHLRKMEVAGLLQAHEIKVKYTEKGKALLPFNSLIGMGFRGDGPAPGVFHRYTLPGMRPTLEIA